VVYCTGSEIVSIFESINSLVPQAVTTISTSTIAISRPISTCPITVHSTIAVNSRFAIIEIDITRLFAWYDWDITSVTYIFYLSDDLVKFRSDFGVGFHDRCGCGIGFARQGTVGPNSSDGRGIGDRIEAELKYIHNHQPDGQNGTRCLHRLGSAHLLHAIIDLLCQFCQGLGGIIQGSSGLLRVRVITLPGRLEVLAPGTRPTVNSCGQVLSGPIEPLSLLPERLGGVRELFRALVKLPREVL
jgi:hypothetical protein